MPQKEQKILLVGNPNVGKSAVFCRLTGANVIISNYPGTTVGFSRGYMNLGNNKSAVIIDIPGIYSLTPLSKMDEISVNMIKDADIIINVIDATNLERNLFLTLELLEKDKPVIAALNMWDETRHKGIEIDVKKLEMELSVPIIPTCALTGVGIKELIEKARNPGKKHRDDPVSTNEQKWKRIGEIVNAVQTLHRHHHTFLERLEDISAGPITGLVTAITVIYLSFVCVRFLGEGLVKHIFAPLFSNFWLPLMKTLSLAIGKTNIIHDVFIGRLIDGKIDFGMSFGILTTGLFVPIVAVLPYILSFYLVLGLLEDFGYLPRLATQFDNLMHRIGLHGYAVIPLILGLGCNVPGIMALRLLESRREKFITATLMAVAVPCMAQIAMITGLVGKRGGHYVALIFCILLVILIGKGLLLNRVLKGKSPEILWEIPPYRLPQAKAVIKKLWMRISGFLYEAVPFVLLGVLIVNIFYVLNFFGFLSRIFSPIVTTLWGLPKETISALLMGFLRKDLAIGMLSPLNLTTKQLVIACTVLTIYFPCMASFFVMLREIGPRDMLKSAGIMLFTSIATGTLLNLISF